MGKLREAVWGSQIQQLFTLLSQVGKASAGLVILRAEVVGKQGPFLRLTKAAFPSAGSFLLGIQDRRDNSSSWDRPKHLEVVVFGPVPFLSKGRFYTGTMLRIDLVVTVNANEMAMENPHGSLPCLFPASSPT